VYKPSMAKYYSVLNLASKSGRPTSSKIFSVI
jgi:hypothetical protein